MYNYKAASLLLLVLPPLFSCSFIYLFYDPWSPTPPWLSGTSQPLTTQSGILFNGIQANCFDSGTHSDLGEVFEVTLWVNVVNVMSDQVVWQAYGADGEVRLGVR